MNARPVSACSCCGAPIYAPAKVENLYGSVQVTITRSCDCFFSIQRKLLAEAAAAEWAANCKSAEKFLNENPYPPKQNQESNG